MPRFPAGGRIMPRLAEPIDGVANHSLRCAFASLI